MFNSQFSWKTVVQLMSHSYIINLVMAHLIALIYGQYPYPNADFFLLEQAKQKLMVTNEVAQSNKFYKSFFNL